MEERRDTLGHALESQAATDSEVDMGFKERFESKGEIRLEEELE